MKTLAILGLVWLAHMHDRPDLDQWFEGLKGSGGMPCCAQVDGTALADPDWDTAIVDGKPHYRVRIRGEWYVVTDEEVVQGPNKYGQPIVWVYWVDSKPQIRCFMPGTGI